MKLNKILGLCIIIICFMSLGFSTTDATGITLGSTTSQTTGTIQGVKLQANYDITLTAVTKSSSDTSNIAKVYSNADVLIDTASFSGDVATFNISFNSTDIFKIVTTHDTTSFNRAYSATGSYYPVIGTNVNYLSGTGTTLADDNDQAFSVVSVTTELTVLAPNVTGGLNDNIVAYYKLENLLDSTPNSYDLTNNGATGGVTGILNNSYSFDGVNDYMDIGEYTVFNNLQTIVFSGWFNTTSTTLQQIYTVRGATNPGVKMTVGINDPTPGDIRIDSASSTNFITLVNPPGSYNDGDWHHIVVSINYITKEYYTYVDNILIGSGTNANIRTYNAFNVNTNNLGCNVPTVQHFDGVVDEVAIFNETLTVDDISFLYNSGAPTVAQQYPFSPLLQVNILNITANNELFVNDTVFETPNIEFKVDYEVINSDIGNFTNTSTISYTDLANGIYNIQFEVCYNSTCDTSINYTYTVNVTTFLLFDSIKVNDVTISNGTYYNVNDLVFNVSILNLSTNGNVNQTYYLYNSTNDLISSSQYATNNIVGSFNLLGLDEGTYYIYFYTQNDETNTTTQNYYFTIDTITPVVTENIPTEIYTYSLEGISINVTDINLVSCIINIDSTNYNCSTFTNRTFSTNGNKSWTITATDLAGNQAIETGVLLVSPTQYIYFNDVNSTQITNFTLGGISYTEYAEINVYDLGLGTHKLLFEKQGFQSGNITITFNETSEINTTYVIPFAQIIFTFYNIIDSSYIEGGNVTTIQIIGDDYSKTFNTTNRNLTIIDSDIVIDTYNVIVSNPEYETVNTLFTYNNQEVIILNIYMTPTDVVGETVADLIVEVQDLDGNVQQNILTLQYIWDSATLQDVLINQKTTDYSGQTSYKVLLDTRLYTFCAQYNSILYCNDRGSVNINTEKVIIPIDTTILEPTDFNTLYLSSFPYSLTNVTTGNTSLITFTWNNPSQDIDNYCLKVYKKVEGVETLLSPNGEQCSTSHNNGLSLSITLEAETVYVAKAVIIQDGEQRILKVITLNEDYELLGFLQTYGLHKIICLVLIFLAIGIGLHPRVHNITITHLSIPISYLIISIIFPTILTLDIFIIVLFINLGTIRLFTKRDDIGSNTKISTILSIVIIYVIMIFTTTTILNDFDDRDLLDDYGTNLLTYLQGDSSSIQSELNTFVSESNEELNSTKSGSTPGGEDKTDNTLTFFIKSLGWVDTFFNMMSKIFAIPQTIYTMLGFTTEFMTGIFFYINWILNIVVMRVFYESLFK